MKKNVFVCGILGLFLIFVFSCSKESRLLREEQKKQAKVLLMQQEAFENFVANTPLKEKICQLFIVNILGDTTYVPLEKDFIPGAYIFFSYNLSDDEKTVMRFTDSVRSYCMEQDLIPPFCAVDQEGGYVNRLRALCGPLPSAWRVAKRMPPEKAHELYAAQAVQMSALGFDVNLAPVVELLTEENAAFLDGRSFGGTEQVVQYGSECVRAYQENGVYCVIKHFPGNTNADPHTNLPVLKWTLEEFEEQITPFKKLLEQNPFGVLISHAKLPVLDAENPGCFSEKCVRQKLQNELGFGGIVFSDDIFMGALANNGFPQEEAAIRAVLAGIDCIMISEKRISSPATSLLKKASSDPDFEKLIDKSFRKIVKAKLERGLLRYEEVSLEESGEPKTTLSIMPYSPYEPVDKRLELFNQAKKTNNELYITYF